MMVKHKILPFSLSNRKKTAVIKRNDTLPQYRSQTRSRTRIPTASLSSIVLAHLTQDPRQYYQCQQTHINAIPSCCWQGTNDRLTVIETLAE